MRLTFLFYKGLVAEMKDKVVEINPYEPCVANEMVGGKQIIIFWRVEDLKVSYVDPKKVTKFTDWLSGIYGELSITRVKAHEYLSMMLYLRTPGDLWLNMLDYIKGVPEDLTEVIAGISMNPAKNDLFQFKPEDEKKLINKERATSSHHIVSQMIFITSRDRKEIKMAIIHLYNRVRSLY